MSAIARALTTGAALHSRSNYLSDGCSWLCHKRHKAHSRVCSREVDDHCLSVGSIGEVVFRSVLWTMYCWMYATFVCNGRVIIYAVFYFFELRVQLGERVGTLSAAVASHCATISGMISTPSRVQTYDNHFPRSIYALGVALFRVSYRPSVLYGPCVSPLRVADYRLSCVFHSAMKSCWCNSQGKKTSGRTWYLPEVRLTNTLATH